MINNIVFNCISQMERTKSQTKKVKNTPLKKDLWNQFDNEFNKDTHIECVYRSEGQREECDVCKSSLWFSEEGFLTCTNSKCGIIYKDIIDYGAEWRYYGADDNQNSDPTRCGMPINPLLKESSYGCKIMGGNSNYEMRKIKRYTEWQSMPYKEKSQYDEFQRITMMATNAGINKYIIDEAISYHKKISEHKTFRGINRDGIIAASIYVAFRINNNPRTAKEIADIFHLDHSGATKGCKNAVNILNIIEEDLDENEKTVFGDTTPQSFIVRYSSRLGINKELTKLAEFIAYKIQKDNLIPENTPHSIAAGIIYYICCLCELNITKKEIHTISQISEVTINKCFKKLEGFTDNLIPLTVKKKYHIK